MMQHDFLYNVIINKQRLLPQAYLTVAEFWLSCLGHIIYLLQKTFKLFCFPIFLL